MSFDDFVWLFELERESTSKKQKLTGQTEEVQPPFYDESPPTSPTRVSYGGVDVILRKNQRRMTMPARLQRHGNRELSILSPITSHNSSAGKRPPSNDVTGT